MAFYPVLSVQPVVSNGPISINAFFVVSEEDFELGDVGYTYPQGFLSFTIDCIDPGYKQTLSSITTA